jgi:DNA-binding FadR family transcriptional regulator
MEKYINKIKAADEVFQHLYAQITNMQIKVGERLPTQEELSARFSVSRNTVRDAITRLNTMGLVITRQGSGTVVTAPPGDSITDIVGQKLILQPAAVSEFLEARMFVERTNVRLAVMRATHQELQQLLSLIEAQKDTFEKQDVMGFCHLDIELHKTIASCSRNRVMNAFFHTIWDKLYQFVAEVSFLQGIVAESFEAHKSLVQCIVARDAYCAERSLTEHLYRTGQGIERNTGTKLGLEAFVDLLHASATKQSS